MATRHDGRRGEPVRAAVASAGGPLAAVATGLRDLLRALAARLGAPAERAGEGDGRLAGCCH